MANKTPPLVIPVVIDSTGVNKGISDINSRLRTGVRGGGAGGGSTPGVGGGSFGGGGGAAEAILGGAVAGGIAARTGGGGGSASGGGMSPRLQELHNRTKEQLNIRNDNFVSRYFQRRAESNFASAQRFANQAPNRQFRMRVPGGYVGPKDPYEDVANKYYEAMSAHPQRLGKMQGFAAKYTGAMTRGPRIIGRKVAGALRNLDAASSGISIGAVAGGAIGLGMVGALRGGGRGDVGELGGLVGSTDYGYLRGMQNRAPSGAPLSVMNSMKIGMAKRAGMGVTTQFENQSNAFNRAVQISGEVVGGVYEGLAQSTTDLLVVIAQNVFGMNKDAGNRQFWEAIQRRATN